MKNRSSFAHYFEELPCNSAYIAKGQKPNLASYLIRETLNPQISDPFSMLDVFPVWKYFRSPDFYNFLTLQRFEFFFLFTFCLFCLTFALFSEVFLSVSRYNFLNFLSFVPRLRRQISWSETLTDRTRTTCGDRYEVEKR